MGIQGKVCGDCKYHGSEQNICTNVKGYKMYASKCSGACHDFTKSSLFDKITASPETLAPLLVSANEWGFHSAITDKGINEYLGAYETEEEAIVATLAELKEVQ